MHMLRLRFGVSDLARTRFAFPPLFCELAGSVQAMQQPASRLRRGWRGTQPQAPFQVAPLLELVPSQGSLPGFLIPESQNECFDATLDAVQSTSLLQIRTEVAGAHPLPAQARWARELAIGHRDSLADLGQAIRLYHRHVFAPMAPALHDAVAAELRRRAWQLASRGIEDVLSTLHPLIRWRDGILEIGFPVRADVDLGGRGLSLCPSAAWTRPGFAFHWEQPGLVYPIPPPDWHLQMNRSDHEAHLAGILGATRARILCTLINEHTTTSLAAALGVSAGSASMHAAALRAAGLVETRRDGRAVRHALTELGKQLVSAPALSVVRSAARVSGS
jgi:DNA-binding transcriptional ArsR family regulator